MFGVFFGIFFIEDENVFVVSCCVYYVVGCDMFIGCGYGVYE